MASEASFDETLAAAQSGDGRAFATLYEMFDRRVHAFVSVRGEPDPDGTVNEVFLKVFTNLGDFQGNEAQFAAWVFTIARHTVIDGARRRHRRVEETALEAGESRAPAGDVESDAAARLGDDWIVEQLSSLTPDQRDVVVLRVVADLTLEDVADVLGKRVGAVKAIQRRAFRTLARNLDAEAVSK